MSSQTSHNRTFLVTRWFLCLLTINLGLVGCSGESKDARSAASLSAPELAKTAGQMQGDPISRPYLTDIGQLDATPVVMRFGDGTLLVQKQGGGKIELIPTPDPDGIGKPEDYNTWPVPDVSLVVTGRQHGYIEPCGCTGLERQKGGMARRYTFMRQLKEKGWLLMPIDGGDQVRRFGHQSEIKLQQTTKALKQMEYQAVGFGPDDLRLGVGELLSVAAAESPD